MKRISFLFFILLVFTFVNAQTKVLKMSATKSTDYGVTYFLPKTVFTVQVNYSKVTQKAGPFAKYAEKYLGLNEQSIIPEDRIYYTLDKVTVES